MMDEQEESRATPVSDLHDVDRVEVRVSEGQLPPQKLVKRDQLGVLGHLQNLPGRLPQPPGKSIRVCKDDDTKSTPVIRALALD